ARRAARGGHHVPGVQTTHGRVPRMTAMTHRARAVGAALAVALLGGACGVFSTPATTGLKPLAPPAAAPNPGPAPSAQPCSDPTASLRPTGPVPRAGDLPNGSTMQQIYNRGRLIAGIAQDTLMFGYLNPLDNQLEGFDIDIIKQLSQSIFG